MIRRQLPLRTLAIPVMLALTTVVAAAAHAHAADIDPVGIGDLMPSPSKKAPAGQGTLFETYSNQSLWMLDSDYGVFDAIDPILEAFADICMILVSTIGMALVVCVQWVFQLTSLPEIESAITDSLEGSAGVLSATILPSAMVIGMLVAFAQTGNGGNGAGISQIVWVMVSGVVSISLLSTPQVWVSGVDTVRTLGASVTMEAASAGVGGSTDFPFKMDHEPKFTGNGRDNMLRISADSIWRSQVATPWCIAEFGSLEVCEKFGKGLLDQGGDKDKRKEWLQKNVTAEAVGNDSTSWRQGHNPLMRLAVTAVALLSSVILAFLLLRLAFASLSSLIGALLLLLCGAFFAALWVIPGRPRKWGNGWFDQLLSRCLDSVISTLVLGAILAVQTACAEMFTVYGWLPTTGLNIAAAAVAMKFRGVVGQIFGVSAGSSSASALGGVLAYRALSRATGRARVGGGDGPRAVTTAARRGGTNGGGGGGGTTGGGPPELEGGPMRAALRPPPPPPAAIAMSVVRPALPPAPSTSAAVPLPRTGVPARSASAAPARPTQAEPAYAFRHIPPPTPPSDTVIRGEVLRRAEAPAYRQPALDGTYPPPQPRRPAPTTAARRPAPTAARRPAPTGQPRQAPLPVPASPPRPPAPGA
ncbi:hypothetical protein ACPXCP_39960 [Streptomyces sp. DT20]|uniref:hypothetical protein n=1 Tax=Streptomyces sp. DT20 TaxID=3416519 RepID=UPI003CE9E7A8